MHNHSLIHKSALILLFLAWLSPVTATDSDQATTTTIAFGSCADDEKPDHPIWDAIIETKPESMIFMGDNVYVDMEAALADGTVEGFRPDYERLANTPGFQRLREVATLHATWDDNEYGSQDGGAEYSLKDVSQRKFFEFWNVDPESERYKTPGVYGSAWVESEHGRIQIILTDTRYFRSPVVRAEPNDECPYVNILPSEDPELTMLGEAQWEWLSERLAEPADLHLLVSSIQVIPEEQCFERWYEMPLERKKLFAAIRNASARTIILTGDRHIGEISRLPTTDDEGMGYDLYDVTSSSLSASFGFGEGEPNRYREGDNVRVNNFGILKVDWTNRIATMELRDQTGTKLRTAQLALDD